MTVGYFSVYILLPIWQICQHISACCDPISLGLGHNSLAALICLGVVLSVSLSLLHS